ncbi:hypothetical protein ACOSQ2_023614 [Xanthoceras sorbifolium]
MALAKKKSTENGAGREEDGVIHRDVKPEKKMVSSSCTRCWSGSRRSKARLPPKLMNCFWSVSPSVRDLLRKLMD